MLTAKDLIPAALEAGFSAAALTDASPTDPMPDGVHAQARKLISDPREILPGARSILVCALGYEPYAPSPGEAAVDAYYVAGNRAHAMADDLARRIGQCGVRAVLTSALRTKPLAARSGLGHVGRNGLLAVGRWGTRITLQVIVTDIPFDSGARVSEPWLDSACAECGLCVAACPTQALRGDGSLDVEKCVRAQSETLPLPEYMRPMTGNSVLGCDLCQRVCPRNAGVKDAPVPEHVAELLRLSRLLNGDYKGLREVLGSNNARRTRLLSRAVLAAANEGRRDLVDALEALTTEPPPLGEHAAWALKRLRGEQDV
ncbi:MAG: epoxyqueuosine reductase [Clostridia bacterium]|nr:epoxyqueuosine reductase [Clostridia bacterium]